MNVFDMIGPVMIGPSSSHTAGAARIGKVARLLLNDTPVSAAILLSGSFAKTYRGHGTDKALVAGILGMEADDERIRNSLQLAEKDHLKVTITAGDIPDSHPNTAQIDLVGRSGRQISVQASSIGGGSICITRINRMPVNISGQHNTLIIMHKDKPGTIAEVTELMAQNQMNICDFHLSRQQRGGIACMAIEIDGEINAELSSHIETLPNILSVTALMLS